MEKRRVLIVEDEPLVSMIIEDIVSDTIPAVVIVKTSVAATKQVLHQPFDLALLDVDVTNGKTFEVAKLLGEKGVPFIFVSGSARDHLPAELQAVPFIAKPFKTTQIQQAILAAAV